MGIKEILKGGALLGASAAIATIGLESGSDLAAGCSDDVALDIVKTGASAVGTFVCAKKAVDTLKPHKVVESATEVAEDVVAEVVAEETEPILDDMQNILIQQGLETLQQLNAENEALTAKVKELEEALKAKEAKASKSNKQQKQETVEAESK